MRSVADGRIERRAFNRCLVLDGREGMRLQPQHAGGDGRINPSAPPPCGFVAAAVDLAMMPAAQRDGELIADLAAERPALGKSQVMGVRGLSAANQARVLGDRPDVIPVADPARLRQGQRALVDQPSSAGRVFGCSFVRPRGLRRGAAGLAGRVSGSSAGRSRKGRQLGLEGLLHALGVRRCQPVLLAQGPMRPDCRVVAAAKVIEFGEKPIA